MISLFCLTTLPLNLLCGRFKSPPKNHSMNSSYYKYYVWTLFFFILRSHGWIRIFSISFFLLCTLLMLIFVCNFIVTMNYGMLFFFTWFCLFKLSYGYISNLYKHIKNNNSIICCRDSTPFTWYYVSYFPHTLEIHIS
jgi:hypothetical protein